MNTANNAAPITNTRAVVPVPKSYPVNTWFQPLIGAKHSRIASPVKNIIANVLAGQNINEYPVLA